MENIPKRPRGRPRLDAVPLTVRVPRDQLASVDSWRERQPDSPSRPEAFRRLVSQSLKRLPKRGQHRWRDHPHLLVYGLRAIGDIWAKMVWDITEFEKLLTNRPVDIVSVPYCYPNVCVSAVALRDWFVEETRLRARKAGNRWKDSDAFEIVRAHVRWSRIAEDVGNTFKHRQYRSEGFVDGVVHFRVTFPRGIQREYDGIEDDWERALFSLRHNGVAIWNVFFRDGETGRELNALEVFHAWEKDWHTLLNDLGMLED